MTFSWDSGDLKEFQTGGPSASATPYLVVYAEKSPSPASPFRGQKNRGAECRVIRGGTSWGSPEQPGGAEASAGAPPSAGLGRAGTAVGERQTPGVDVVIRRRKRGSARVGPAFSLMDRSGTGRPRSGSVPLLAAPRRGSRGAPPAFAPGRGDAVRGRTKPGGRRGAATRARRLRARPEAALPVPGLPESARPAAAPSPRKRLTARARPRSPRLPSAAGWLSPRGKAQTATRAGTA